VAAPQRLVLPSTQATFDELAPVARTLLDGGLVACPTQTFYALMALVDTPKALERLTRLKGLEARRQKPFLILIDQPGRIHCYAREVPEEAAGLMAGFWPGSLTLLLLAQNGLHPSLVGPARTVGVRVEELELVRRLVRMVDRGLTGTSANPPGQPPATTADQVAAYFGDQLDLIIDAGPTPGGQPSTIIDASLGAPRILRDGGLPLNELIQACPILRFKAD
jgi:L-threonylcarbamoyladenylate synthase